MSTADEYTRSVLTTRHPTVPLEVGCRVEMMAPRSYDAGGFLFAVGHVYYGFEPGDREDLVQWRLLRQLRDREEKGIGAEHGCACPLTYTEPRPREENPMHLLDIHTKPEAVAFVSAVMQSAPALLSPNFALAMDVSRLYDVSTQDVLEFRREKARRE